MRVMVNCKSSYDIGLITLIALLNEEITTEPTIYEAAVRYGFIKNYKNIQTNPLKLILL